MKLIKIVAIPLIVSATAYAGPIASQGYFEAGLVTGEYTLDAGNLVPGLGSASDDVTGFRLLGGFNLVDAFSFDARYEHTETSDDFEADELRLLFNAEAKYSDNLSFVGGLGYAWMIYDFDGFFEIDGDGFIVNLGPKYVNGPVFGSLIYSHIFVQNAEVSVPGVGSADLANEDVGLLEATVGYNINEDLAVTLSYETQIGGDTVIDKDWVAALGLRFNF
ncbi:MAG: autotransporter outer membrane beta-barrel domain-containing protein [Luteolibacter sp.]